MSEVGAVSSSVEFGTSGVTPFHLWWWSDGSIHYTVTISGLDFSTSDKEVFKYLNKFGLKTLLNPKYRRYTNEPWKGVKNGTSFDQVDFEVSNESYRIIPSNKWSEN